MDTFFNLFKNIRKSKNITQTQLAEKSGLSQTFFVKIEKHNTVPNNENFIKICEALELTYDELKSLHIAYEKLIKPLKAEELILSYFPKSEFIFSKFIEDTIFHNILLNIYKKAYNGNKYLVYYEFLKQVYYLLECLKYDTLTINTETLYSAIDIIKHHSNKLFQISDFEINQTNDKFKLLKIIPQIVNDVRMYKSSGHGDVRNILDDFIEKYNIIEILKEMRFVPVQYSIDKKIEILKKLLCDLVSNNRFISPEGRYFYSNECSGFAKAIPICNDYFKYAYLVSEIVFSNNHTTFIETNEGYFIELVISRLFDSISLKDIIDSHISPIENRLEILKQEVKEILELLKDIMPIENKDKKIQEILNNFISTANGLKYYLKFVKNKLNKRKKYDNLLEKIQKEKIALELENAYLKDKLKKLESATCGKND